jgi:hypothetical protein
LKKQISGQQIWPDLPTSHDIGDEFYDGGDNNYWNWSKPGFDEFFRTDENRYVYDFSLAEAMSFAETFVVRPAHDELTKSTLTGLAPCHGPSRGYGEVFREGLNQRVDNCPGDYTYNKTLAIAYLATADRRFSDFFAEAGLGTIDVLGNPAEIGTGEYMELTVGRLAEQRLETVMNGAEFARDSATSAQLRGALRQYVDLMLDQTLIDGHMCDVSGRGVNSACAVGSCESTQAWMVPTPYQCLVRASRFLHHDKLKAWTIDYGRRAMEFHTSMKGGIPDGRNLDAWSTMYACDTDAQGVVNTSCKKLRDVEAQGRFYDNGLLAFFNVFGLMLAIDHKDPHQICDWLPEHYFETLAKIPRSELNAFIWGKSSGQALAFAPETVGALSQCK